MFFPVEIWKNEILTCFEKPRRTYPYIKELKDLIREHCFPVIWTWSPITGQPIISSYETARVWLLHINMIKKEQCLVYKKCNTTGKRYYEIETMVAFPTYILN